MEIQASFLDLWVLVGFGLIGYGFRKLAIDPAPLIVAVVLGPIMEKRCARRCSWRTATGACWSCGP